MSARPESDLPDEVDGTLPAVTDGTYPGKIHPGALCEALGELVERLSFMQAPALETHIEAVPSNADEVREFLASLGAELGRFFETVQAAVVQQTEAAAAWIELDSRELNEEVTYASTVSTDGGMKQLLEGLNGGLDAVGEELGAVRSEVAAYLADYYSPETTPAAAAPGL